MRMGGEERRPLRRAFPLTTHKAGFANALAKSDFHLLGEVWME
jgi:hypothetical protein